MADVAVIRAAAQQDADISKDIEAGSKSSSSSSPSSRRCCFCIPCCSWWVKASCRARCGCCFLTTVVVLSIAWGFFCAAALCCNEIQCDAAPGGFGSHPNASRIPVLFVPGFTGTTLLQGGDMVYLTGAQAVGLSAPPLGLPPYWDGVSSDASSLSFSQRRDGIEAGEPVEDVRFASCIRVAIYAPFLSWAQNCMGRPFHTFPFDWRRDPWENANALVDKIRAVSAAHGGLPVQLLGHSNGGVLSLIATTILLKQGEHLVHSLIYAGAPFKGGYGVLEGFTSGLTIGLTNTKSIDAKAAMTIAGRLVFLPLVDGADDDDSYLLDSVTGLPVRLNISDPQTLLDWGLTSSASSSDPYFTGLLHGLAKAKLAREHMVYDPALAYPPSAVVASKEYQVGNANFTADVARRRLSLSESVGTEGGDGSVRYSAALPPHPYGDVHLVKAGTTHQLLLNDLDAVRAAMAGFTYLV
jgi:pimeloyl-ACP methyl ester carboxylesterase